MALRARKVSGASETLWRHCGWRHSVVFLGDSLYFQSASLHSDVQRVAVNLMLGITLQCTSQPEGGGGARGGRGGRVKNIPCRFMQQKLNRDKLRPDRPLGGMQTFLSITIKLER